MKVCWYIPKTQNVYGFEKGNAALFLQIDELIEVIPVKRYVEQFHSRYCTLETMYDLTTCKETTDNHRV